MTIRDLYQVLDNMTIRTRFYIIGNDGKILEWGSNYPDISLNITSLPIVHCKYDDGDMIIWV